MTQANPSLLERIIQPYLISYQSETKERRYSLPLSPRISVSGALVYPETQIPLEFFSVESQLKLIKSLVARLFSPIGSSPVNREGDNKASFLITNYAVIDFICLSCRLNPFR